MASATDHAPVSRDGLTCDICGRTVTGRTTPDGHAVIQGDVVGHVWEGA